MIKLSAQLDVGAPLEGMTPEQLTALSQDAILGIKTSVRQSFADMGRQSNSRNFWHNAISSIQTPEGSHGSAQLLITAVGVRLQWKGGINRPSGKISEVTGKPIKSLLVPFKDSPLRKRRCSLAELGYNNEDIFVLKSKAGAPMLVHAKQLKKKTKLTYLGGLHKQTVHKPHPEVMPSDEQLMQAAEHAADQHIQHYIQLAVSSEQ